jgi:hypothetical protein
VIKTTDYLINNTGARHKIETREEKEAWECNPQSLTVEDFMENQGNEYPTADPSRMRSTSNELDDNCKKGSQKGSQR